MGELNLFSWIVAYIKYKDSIRGKISEINENSKNNIISIKNKDSSTETYLCKEKLLDLDIKSLTNEKIVCLNRKENVDWLITNWDVIKDKKCTFLFVNVKRSENWAINPALHHSITDKSALKPGLKSLFESIPAD